MFFQVSGVSIESKERIVMKKLIRVFTKLRHWSEVTDMSFPDFIAPKNNPWVMSNEEFEGRRAKVFATPLP